MGLDSVELVMAIEEEFKISIPDAAAEKMTTVGAMVDYVHALYTRSERLRCRTAAVFFEMRRQLTNLLQVPPRSLRPSTALSTIVEPPVRRTTWRSLSRSGFAMPTLEYQPFAKRIITGTLAIVAVLAWMMFICFLPTYGANDAASIGVILFFLSLLVILLILPVLKLSLRPCRTELPVNFKTLRDLTLFICTHRGIPVAFPGLQERELSRARY